MLERETEIIIGAIAQRTIGHAPSVALKEILASDIPGPVRTFFRADVEGALREDVEAYFRRSRFNHEHPEVRSAWTQLNSSLVLHHTFQRNEYLTRLTDAVHLLSNYIIRPQWTMTGVIFERNDSVTTTALGHLLGYFQPYEYLGAILSRYAADNSLRALTRNEFGELLWRIDAEYVRRRSGAELASLLEPAFSFFEFPRETGAATLPVKALVRFFEEKGIVSICSRLEGELAQGVSHIDKGGLVAILDDVREGSGPFHAERLEKKLDGPVVGDVAAPEQADAGRGDQPEATSAPAYRMTSPGSAGMPGPAGTPASPRTPSSASIPIQAPPPTPTPIPARGPAPVPYTAPPREAAPGGIDIGSAISEAEKRRFVRRIFRQEDDRFEDAVAMLNTLPGWKQASRYIDEIFIANEVDPYSADAERFIEIVFKQFHPTR